MIREFMPDVAITTDVIVGFPGETDEMFRDGYEALKRIGFSEMHVFPLHPYRNSCRTNGRSN